MRILQTVVAFAVIAVAWWSMAEALSTANLLQAVMPHALGEPMPVSERGVLIFSDHAPSLCCRDFDTALMLSIWGTLLGGFPMAGLAFVLRRRMAGALASGAQPWVMAAFVFQCAAMMLAGLVTAACLWFLYDAPTYVRADTESVIFVGYMLLTTWVSAWALRAWHTLHSRIAPAAPIALTSEG